MTKKIMAFLTSILCMASMTVMNAGALSYIPSDAVVYETEDDYMAVECDFSTFGLYVNTGGEVLTADMVQPLYPIDESLMDPIYEPDRSPLDYLGNRVGVASWKDFVSDGGWNDYELMIDLDENGYVISCADDERMETLARRLMIEYDFVKDVQILTTKRMGNVCFEPTFAMRPVFASEDIDPTAIDVPELKDFYFDELEGSIFLLEFPERTGEGSYTEWYTSVTMPDFFNEFHAANPQYNDLRFEYSEEMVGTKVRSVYSSYQAYKWMTDYCNAVAEKYPDVFESLTPLVFEPSHKYIDGAVCWNEYVGDTNTDGEVDAADAADVLVIAAQNGTGAGIKATSANDVNADGYVDASDAAAVLSYAAAKGTGADVSWVDILRK